MWPLSQPTKPKQFLKFASEHSLIQDTVLRCGGETFDPKPVIVCSEAHRFLVAEHLREIDAKAEIILEPMGRDSCAAVAAGCLAALQRSELALVLVLAADHRIRAVGNFREAVAGARVAAEAGNIVTFGIKPSYPSVGFGYVKPSKSLVAALVHKVEMFVEKPDRESAKRYIDSGYYWNSGNFLMGAAQFLAELKLYAPEILTATQSAFDLAKRDVDFVWLDSDAFRNSPKFSVDYAVLEKTKNAAVCPVDYDWSDVGSWDAVYELLEKDGMGNAVVGHGALLAASNNLIYSQDVLTTIVGVDDLFVINTSNGTLVTKRDNSARLKLLLAELLKNPI